MDIKEVFENLKDSVGSMLFAYVQKQIPDFKEFLLAKLEDAREDLASLLTSDKFEEAYDKFINDIIDKINLPWFVKPFKGLIKKEVKKKLNDLILSKIKMA